jgi:5-methylcytosine-specific restriction endonuclease McrA
MAESGVKNELCMYPIKEGTDTLRLMRERLIRNAKLRGRPVNRMLLRGCSIDPLFDRQGGVCARCREPLVGSFDVDHINPRSRGGSDDLDNLQLLCISCHRKKTALERRRI